MRQSKTMLSWCARSFLVGLFFGIFFWISETMVHTYIFRTKSFLDNLFPDDENELYMRTLIAILNIIFIMIIGCIINKKARLRQQLSLMEKAINAMHEACIITNHENKIIYVNPRYESISGYQLAEVIGKNPHILSSGKQN